MIQYPSVLRKTLRTSQANIILAWIGFIGVVTVTLPFIRVRADMAVNLVSEGVNELCRALIRQCAPQQSTASRHRAAAGKKSDRNSSSE